MTEYESAYMDGYKDGMKFSNEYMDKLIKSRIKEEDIQTEYLYENNKWTILLKYIPSGLIIQTEGETQEEAYNNAMMFLKDRLIVKEGE